MRRHAGIVLRTQGFKLLKGSRCVAVQVCRGAAARGRTVEVCSSMAVCVRRCRCAGVGVQ